MHMLILLPLSRISLFSFSELVLNLQQSLWSQPSQLHLLNFRTAATIQCFSLTWSAPSSCCHHATFFIQFRLAYIPRAPFLLKIEYQ